MRNFLDATETLNRMLDEEADRLCNAQRYEHSERRKDTRAGHYKRQLHTKAGQVELKTKRYVSMKRL